MQILPKILYTSKNNTLTKNKKNDILLVENKEDFILW